MDCRYFGECGSCNNYVGGYEAQLERKISSIKELFNPIYSGDFEVFTSSHSRFRYRIEFKIYHDGGEISYAMGNASKDGHILIKACEIVHSRIYELMPKLLDAIRARGISHRLFGVDFLTNGDEVLVSMLYHRKLDDSWIELAKEIESELGIKIIGRSRKQKIVLSEDFIIQTIDIDGRNYRYKYIENSFTQPNIGVNRHMIEWTLKNADGIGSDLLELYCGAGNFTLAFASKFDRVLATEVSKSSIVAARYNCEINNIENIDFIRLSAQELIEALDGVREFNRLRDIDINSFNLKTIFVDPPRSGIGYDGAIFASRFDNIIYISCNPLTLREDLDVLSKTHDIVSMAMFDQFAYTTHLEMGVRLVKRG